MSRYRSADQHMEGSELVARPKMARGLSSLPDLPNDAPHSGGFRIALEWIKPVAAGFAVLVAVAGLLFLLANEAYGVKPQASFPCPPETLPAVQAATGCVMPTPDQDSWTGIP